MSNKENELTFNAAIKAEEQLDTFTKQVKRVKDLNRQIAFLQHFIENGKSSSTVYHSGGSEGMGVDFYLGSNKTCSTFGIDSNPIREISDELLLPIVKKHMINCLNEVIRCIKEEESLIREETEINIGNLNMYIEEKILLEI
jgi:hypothetical protein